MSPKVADKAAANIDWGTAMQSDNASRRRSKLTTAQQALLERRIKGSAVPSKRAGRIAARPSAEYAPLSFSQHRLWFLDQLQPGDPAYNILVIVRFRGVFIARILEQVINEIVKRHEILRTRFVQIDGQPLQIVDRTHSFRLQVDEIAEAVLTDADLARLAREEGMKSFDLANGPLFRLRAFRSSDDEHLVVMTMHHIISDGWSMRILAAEIRSLYIAFSAGLPSPLAILPVQYADYATWQRRWLTGEILQGQLEYWKAALSNAPHLELPTDRIRPLVQSSRGASITVQVPELLTSELLEFSRGRKATVFMTLLAGFKILLSSWTGQKDVVVGTPIAGRNDPEVEGLIGFFVNNLVLRTDLSGDPSFVEVVDRVREVTLGAYAHQDVPFEKLVEVLRPTRDLSRSPIFQVLVNSHELEIVSTGHENGVFEVVEEVLSETRTDSKFDLNLYLKRQDGGIGLKLVYNCDLFHESTMERLLQRYATALEALVRNPTMPLSALSLLSEADRECLLRKWNDTGLAYPQDRCIHELFTEQSMMTPEALAVVSQKGSLTYRELDERSNHLARRLMRVGVVPETIVGICADRSLEMIVGLLAILKTGGAYLPLDPGYPDARLSYMLDNAKVRIVVAGADYEGVFSGTAVVMSPFELEQDAGEVANNRLDIHPFPRVSSRNLAYIIYTSGSTGQPKGVMVEHRQVLNYVFGIRKRVPLAEARNFAMLQSLTVGSAITVLFPSLLFGRCLHLIDRSVALDAEAFGSYVASHEIDCLKMAPSYLLALMDAAKSPAKLLSSVIVVAGEPLSADLARRVQSSRPGVRLFNHYGTTETTIGVLTHRVAEESADRNANIPLGQPLANCRIYILDDRLNLVPIGAVGDIYVAADSLTRGYLGAAALTAERYLPNPFDAGPTGERLYRTGDVGRRGSDGAVEFLGRVDDQVKLRGFRIELGEIETALASHAKIREARVFSDSTLSGELQLVAFVVTHNGDVDLQDLSRHLRSRLPEYMIPTHYKIVEAMPRTPHGKVDRRALLADISGGTIVQHEYVAPRTSSEEVLTSIWGELLGLERVGVHDNFFELGGHSLLATRLIARIRDAFRIELPLQAVFEAPNVAELAGRIEAAQRQGLGLTLPALAALQRPEVLPLSYAQERLWLLEQIGSLGAAYNMPAAVRLHGVLNAAALQRTFATIVERHEGLRARFTVMDGKPAQVIDPVSAFELTTEDFAGWPEGERAAAVRQRMTELMQQPFDLERDALFRTHLLRLSDEEHVAVVVMHHIVSDGWSIGVLIHEVGALYAAFCERRPSPLPALKIQYADYALWQRRWLQGEALEKQVSYWRQHLEGAPAALELPTDRRRPAIQSYRGAGLSVELRPELTAKLHALARSEGATLFMVLLAALNVVLSRWSGQRDIVVGSPIAGRTHRELEGLIGFFVNTLALRTKLSGDPSFKELLGRVKEAAFGAYAHQELPFEKLLEVLQPIRDLSRQPIFQVLFALQNVPQEQLDLPGIKLSRLSGPSATSKLDLSLYVYERGDRLEAHFEYATDLFERSTIDRMAEQLLVVLEGVVVAPHARLSELPLLSDAEHRRVVVDWNNTASAYPGDRCIHELFEIQAAKAPDATALVHQGGLMTYGELDRRSNQLAHHLRALGVGPEVIVGLSVGRSPQMVVGLLGILKAGGAYLPLDPSYPVDRLAYMVANSGTQLLVTEGDNGVSLAAGSVRMLQLDTEAEAIARHPITPLRGIGVTSQNLVYVLYTSGSTGKPKGVMGTHGAIVNRLHWDATDPSGDETYIQKTTPNFIDMLWEVFMPLMRGQRIAIADEESTKHPLQLIELLGQFKATRIVLVPSLLHAMLESREDLQSRLPHLRYWACSGEALNAELVGLFKNRLPKATLYNIYGTSEFWDASWAVADLEDARQSIAIGRPISNMQAYVLEDGAGPAPLGVGGDLYIGGLGLARGYLKRPGLTAERFVPSPFGTGERLYRTGDLARWRPDGQLEYLGRVDHQVKLRGFRIELGEIEARLAEHPDVHQAVVVAREDAVGDKRLVAYVVPGGATAVTIAELRSHLKQMLPEHMLPSAFVLLETLPLTPNGKVDRRALPAPEGNAVVRGEYVAPQAPVEQALAEIWRDVLKLDRVGVHDNFFELGGHSLQLTQVYARVVRKIGKEFPIALLFQYPTIHLLSDYFSGQKAPAEQMHLSAERGRRRRQSSELRTGRPRAEKRG